MSWRETYAKFRDRFAEALNPKFYTTQYIDWLLETGRAGIWATEQSAIVAEIKTFPTGVKAVAGVVAVGDRQEIIGLIAHAEAWGRENGCQYGMIESRPGWERTMKSYGYNVFQVSILKEL